MVGCQNIYMLVNSQSHFPAYVAVQNTLQEISSTLAILYITNNPIDPDEA